MSIQCVITGCALVVAGDGWVAGDLFDGGSSWVFCGNVSNNQPQWLPIADLHYSKQLRPRDWFEKRGVFIIDKSEANLNEAALEYIGRAL